VTASGMNKRCGAPLAPRDGHARSNQVSFEHDDGDPIMQALIDFQVIGDFRAPDVLRFGLTPLTLRHVDNWDAVAALEDVLRNGAWRERRFNLREVVI
jgi:kynureninase